ncbi:MAG: ATP-binding protein [Bacteroidota bacterium]
MPQIPTLPLPPKPFRSLERFRRADAEILFGRAHDIRRIFDLAVSTSEERVIQLHGQSGVGKSSLLDAGLLPILEQRCKVVYVRRKAEEQLIGTVLEVLAGESNVSWTDYSELGHIPGPQKMGEAARWIWKDHIELYDKADRPFILILDQVDEAFDSDNEELPQELEDFFLFLREIFYNKADRPKGKIILSYRKEHHSEIDGTLYRQQLPTVQVYLRHLNRKEIIEAITGLTSAYRLQAHYNLTIEEGLPERIADDLLQHRDSPIAPMLQILLTKMWDKVAGDKEPAFTTQLYEEFKGEGLDDFLEQQLDLIEQQFPEEVSSGLVLSVLHAHSTDNLKSASLSRETGFLSPAFAPPLFTFS